MTAWSREREERFLCVVLSFNQHPSFLFYLFILATQSHKHTLSAHQLWPDSLSAMATVHTGLNRKVSRQRNENWEFGKITCTEKEIQWKKKTYMQKGKLVTINWQRRGKKICERKWEDCFWRNGRQGKDRHEEKVIKPGFRQAFMGSQTQTPFEVVRRFWAYNSDNSDWREIWLKLCTQTLQDTRNQGNWIASNTDYRKDDGKTDDQDRSVHMIQVDVSEKIPVIVVHL